VNSAGSGKGSLADCMVTYDEGKVVGTSTRNALDSFVVDEKV
jgi:hypothetical protein